MNSEDRNVEDLSVLGLPSLRVRNTKPWNHLHMCTAVLWTKIVVEFL